MFKINISNQVQDKVKSKVITPAEYKLYQLIRKNNKPIQNTIWYMNSHDIPVPSPVSNSTAHSNEHLCNTRVLLKSSPAIDTYKTLTITPDKVYPGITITPVTYCFNKYNELKHGKIKELKSELRNRIKDARNDRRNEMREDRLTTNSITHSGESFQWVILAGVHTTVGKFLEIKDAKLRKEVYLDKKPTTNDKYLGIELEFFCTDRKNDLGTKLYNAGLAKYVCLKSDGSIGSYPDGYHPHEINILVKESEYHEVVRKVTEVLESVSAKVNKTCGMHVHLDMRSRNKEIVFSNLVSSQPQLYAMNPLSRESGTYSKPTVGKTFTTNGDRYRGINGKAFNEHQTIEVRLHAGTVDYTKITNWIAVLVSIANKDEEIAASCRTTKSFISKFGIPTEVANYVEERIAKFNKQRESGQHEEEVA